MSEAKGPGGRPTKFKPEYCELAYNYCLLGATDEQIASFFKISLYELAQWAFENKSFFEAITPTEQQRSEWNEKFSKARERRRKANKSRLENNPSARLENSMRARLWAALKGKTKGKLLSRLDYNVDQLREHLESRFSPGMTWDNYGKWHVDHIKPCAIFDLENKDQFSECWAIENLQPLWADENLKKGARYVCA